MSNKQITLLASVLLLASAPAAANSLIEPGVAVTVAKSTLTIKPASEWNKLSWRPGRNSETWTLDGNTLNDVTFYGGLIDGVTLFREVSKRERPLPRVSATMLLTDIPALLESSYRIARNTPLMTIDSVEPASFAGARGVRFTYSFTLPNEEVQRRGEARAALVGGKLFMITYEAPALHYFDKSLAAFRQLADSAAF